ncbi:nicotinamide riboside transporter PnuC [Methanobrevibacter sp.]|uniref:nicotinamide riboside transporter PnuC n=1 Tax=Methanobrevibacter sp. TaxID=66852 RepID=UPI00388E375B
MVSIVNKESPLGFVAAVSGVMAVVLAGKGKLSTYLLGLVHVVTYETISFYAKFYGIVMLNFIYYLPMEFYGLYVWSKHMNPATNEVHKMRLPLRSTLILLVIVAILTMAYGSILMLLNGNLPFVDALGTVVAVVAMYISLNYLNLLKLRIPRFFIIYRWLFDIILGYLPRPMGSDKNVNVLLF